MASPKKAQTSRNLTNFANSANTCFERVEQELILENIQPRVKNCFEGQSQAGEQRGQRLLRRAFFARYLPEAAEESEDS